MEQLTGRVLRRGDSGFCSARRGFADRAKYDDHEPALIVYAQTVDDVQSAVRWARHHRVPFRIRSGGHSFEALSSLVKGGLILDVSYLNTFDPSGWVGAGMKMLELSEHLATIDRSIPLATSPSVGIAGLTLGGGFGLTSRRDGLTCDSLRSVQLVNTEGELMVASQTENADLFWALQGGGGGNFGVVTALEYEWKPAGSVVPFRIHWDWSQFEDVVAAWQVWAHECSTDLTCLLSLHADRTLFMEGLYAPTDEDVSEFTEVIRPLLAQVPAHTVEAEACPFQMASYKFFEVDPENPCHSLHDHARSQMFKSSSSFAYQDLPSTAITLLRHQLESCPVLHAPPSQTSMVQILAGGGKVAERKCCDSAAFHRGAKFLLQFNGYWTDARDSESTTDWVRRMRSAMAPFSTGAYVNYHDLDLLSPMDEYYGSNVSQLRVIKSKYDPENFFTFSHAIF